VDVGDGLLTAPRVLISCGAWSRELVRRSTGVRVPLDTERGYHLMLPAEKERLALPVASAERRFIMTPMEGGLRLAGTVEFAGVNRPGNMKRAWRLRENADALLRESVDVDGAETWMGCRPTLPDCLPVIDRAGPEGRVLLAFGHHHLGLTQAAITAKMLHALYRGQEPPLPPGPYRLDRFGRGRMKNADRREQGQ
jgi:D-hydroxyproline dehydrogenase